MSGETAVHPRFTRLLNAFLEYETAKVVHISNKTVGLINRIIQLAIVMYIALYVIWDQRGYQDFESATCASTTKLKGFSITNFTQLNISIPGGADGLRVWDVSDYVIPPQENDAFFVTTNLVITPNQTQGRCPEDPGVYGSHCKSDADCPYAVAIGSGNGIRTGKCVASAVNPAIKTCEIFAWCPSEIDKLPIKGKAMMEDSQDFTVLIKNYIEFPKFGVKLYVDTTLVYNYRITTLKHNIFKGQNKSYLQNCRFDQSSEVDRLCPIFTIKTIMKEAGVANYSNIAVYGGVVVINIEWKCNLDLSLDNCRPEYTFSRLDEANEQIAKGANFRYAAMYEKNGRLYRHLFKAYGIRFLIKATGTAGKFSIVPLLLNVGSGVGLLAVASIACDIIVLYFMKKRHIYKNKKYLYVDDENQQQMVNDGDNIGPCAYRGRRQIVEERRGPAFVQFNHDNDKTMLET